MRWAGIILAPALRPIVQLAAALVLAASIVIVLFGFVAEAPRDPNLVRYFACNLQIEHIVQALEEYKADCGAFPSGSDGLRVLVIDVGNSCWKGPYLNDVPLDPWNRPFVYLLSENSAPEVISYGADRSPGGEHFDADISSRHLARSIPRSPFEVRAQRILLGTWIGAWIGLVGSVIVLTKTRSKKSRRE